MIASVKRWCGKMHDCLTRLQKDIIKLEEKGLTPSDLWKIKRLKKLAEENDHEFD